MSTFRKLCLMPTGVERVNLLLVILIVCITGVYAQNDSTVSDPESVVRYLYDQVTFPAGKTPDWDHVRTLFLKEANIVMRIGKTETASLSLDGWILDFVNFINNSNIISTGFEEKIIKMESMIFGDIAHVLVLYKAFIPGKSKTPQEGVDSFHLAKSAGKWKIVSILNEIPGPNRPKPEILLD